MPNYLIKYYSTTHKNLTNKNIVTKENCKYEHCNLLSNKATNNGNDEINLDKYATGLRSVYEIMFTHLCFHSDISVSKFYFFSPQHVNKELLKKVMVKDKLEYGFSFLSIKEVA